jgi:hypothetical protein
MLKKSIGLTIGLLVGVLFATYAQTVTTVDQRRKIEVTGYSELEVVPDELYFSISLKEYYKDEKNQKDKVIITDLEKQLLQAVTNAGLSKDALSLESVGGYHNYVDKKKKPTTFLESKSYILKVDKPDKLDVVLSKIDNRGLTNAYVQRVDHSKKEEFKKQVKINALKDAKEKASYLLESIDQKIYQPLEIRELDENTYYPQPVMYKASMMRAVNAEMADSGVEESSIEYKKIKLSYRMQAVFEIR